MARPFVFGCVRIRSRSPSLQGHEPSSAKRACLSPPVLGNPLTKSSPTLGSQQIQGEEGLGKDCNFPQSLPLHSVQPQAVPEVMGVAPGLSNQEFRPLPCAHADGHSNLGIGLGCFSATSSSSQTDVPPTRGHAVSSVRFEPAPLCQADAAIDDGVNSAMPDL